MERIIAIGLALVIFTILLCFVGMVTGLSTQTWGLLFVLPGIVGLLLLTGALVYMIWTNGS